MRISLGTLFGCLVLLGATTAGAESLQDIDYADYDVRVTDSKGIATEVSHFGFWSGPNVLEAQRGDALVEIPFRRIQSIELGAYAADKGVSPCVVVTRAGKRYELTVDRTQGQRLLGGDAEFGSYRIRLMQIARLELKGLTSAGGAAP